MQISAPIFYLKRQAKQLARDGGLPLHAALNKVAADQGFQSWSHLSNTAPNSPAQSVLAALTPGELVLIAARPGQGKTLLALEILAEATKAGHAGAVFSLDYTAEEIAEPYHTVGGRAGDAVRFDVADEISADYITSALDGAGPGTVAVIDYLQLLDQRRAHPPLDAQVAQLSAFARRSGVSFLCISQIDRRFDPDAKAVPDASDIRLPNPVDLTLFARAVFLHGGATRIAPL
ncbi:Replicative DNA helicase [Candidatus Rhodobacter oscarellae]|uniref:Replicative DNA helicase n=1 Tax=Candidatus Rhodobacter oscarellae TaxID=1675527 RepID=A0A0J9GY51_9RHOB|nr:DNA helicase [Candidatus Rhodobacter lobularis]KMW58403.1 Replicative DNA helicase [Candidatus Rhodobacter lobularis]